MTDNTMWFPHLNNNNNKTALIDGSISISYATLNRCIEQLVGSLLINRVDLNEERIAFFVPASLHYVTALFAIWRAGGIAVPLNVSAALPELEHALATAGVTRLLTVKEYLPRLVDLCTSLQIEILTLEQPQPAALQLRPLPQPDRRAMILFTSGTTSKPKGVVSAHKTIRAQVRTLTAAWAWEADDTIPLFLPLHHIHGIINVLCCGLWAGATITLFPKFDMEPLLQQISQHRYSVFMAVPTIYVKIIMYLDTLDAEQRELICSGFAAMRLNVSGSAACPVKVYNDWLDLTGQTLLERYGMTEIGMAIANPYNGERRAGAVGIPLPGVRVALFDEDHRQITREDTPGEIRIQGDNVFIEYWQNQEATTNSFHEGWFCTGDVAVLESGYYRIMGRSSVDIIKSGGYKLSALEIEGTLLTHDAIAECAVVGVEDDTWGEAVTAFIVLKSGDNLEYEGLKVWCETRMSPYKIPKRMVIRETLPRNAMGKVTKPDLKKLLSA